MEKLGQGPVGEVFKAMDPGLQRVVAVKWLWPHLSGEAAFWDDILPMLKKLQEIKYEGIAGVYAVDEAEGRFVIVEEFVEGYDFVTYVRDCALSLKSFLVVAQEITRSLKYAHDHGILHANLKPSNVLIRPDGRVRIMDFGQSRYLTPQHFEQDIPASVLRYLAPEQLRRDAVTKATDLYALGAIFYEGLCGRPVYPQNDMQTLLKAIDASEPSSKPLQQVGVSGDMIFLVEKLLSWKPAERLGTMGELLINLQAIADFERTHPAGGPLHTEERNTPRQYLMVSILVALLLIFWLIITSHF
jgi:serine/threonine-protein kinase